MMVMRNSLLACLAIAFLSACAKQADSTPRELFVSMIMTKKQQASSIPTDFGVLVRNAETGEWRRLGPAIQMISSATADPSDPDTLYLAGGNGISRTTDGGDTWKLVSGWRESDITQIVIDPKNRDRLYAASAWGVSVSRDGGDSWTAANEGLQEYFSKGIVLDEHDSARLLLATGAGLYVSYDGAGSWSPVPGFPKVNVLRLRRGENDPDLWLAGTEGRGVWISKDDGRTWTGSALALAEANIYAVAVSPQDASHLAAGGWNTGVHFSKDSGAHWAAATGTLPSPNITAMVFDPTLKNRLWVSMFEEGTYYTDDFGKTWESAELDGAYVFDLGFLPTPKENPIDAAH